MSGRICCCHPHHFPAEHGHAAQHLCHKRVPLHHATCPPVHANQECTRLQSPAHCRGREWQPYACKSHKSALSLPWLCDLCFGPCSVAIHCTYCELYLGICKIVGVCLTKRTCSLRDILMPSAIACNDFCRMCGARCFAVCLDGSCCSSCTQAALLMLCCSPHPQLSPLPVTLL